MKAVAGVVMHERKVWTSQSSAPPNGWDLIAISNTKSVTENNRLLRKVRVKL